MKLTLPLSMDHLRRMRVGDSLVTTTECQSTNGTFHARGMRVHTARSYLIVEDSLVVVTVATFLAVYDEDKYRAFMYPKQRGPKTVELLKDAEVVSE